MTNLIKAEIYKTIKKKSFFISIMLIIFVSIFYLILINKNLKIDYNYTPVPLLNENEYTSLYKGDYEKYKKQYSAYVSTFNNKVIIKQEESSNKGITLLENSYPLFFLVGIIIIFIAYQSLSYDYQQGTIKYIFISVDNRKKLIVSKITSIMLISLLFIIITIIIMFITCSLLTHQNMFLINKMLLNSKSVNMFLYFIYKALFYLLPIIFIMFITLFLTILFKGNALSVIISLIIYMFSLTLTNLALSYNLLFVKYTFLPYLDFTFFEDKPNALLLNSLYNVNFNYQNGFIIFMIYILIIFFIISKLLKRDV